MLKDYAILKFTGNDAVSFLHGQCTSDIEAQAANTSSLTSWCNAKGQVIVTGILYKTEHELFFIIHISLQDFVEKQLRMFVLRSDVSIENITKQIHLIASDDNNQIILPTLTNVGLLISEQEQSNTLDDNAFALHCIQAGIPWLTQAHQEQYQPQMLNMDLLQGLSYQKGCYPGQEVVARLHYRGTIKKRLFIINCESSMEVDDELITNEEKNGSVINIAKADSNYIALAVCNIEIKEAKEVTCNGNNVKIIDS